MRPVLAVLICATLGCGVSEVDRQKKAAHQVDKILTARQQRNETSARWASTGPRKIPQDVLRQVKGFDEEILLGTQQVDTKALNQIYPELGSTLERTLHRSIVLHMEAQLEYMDSSKKGSSYSPDSDRKEAEANALDQEWDAWFRGRTHEVAEALRSK